MNENKSKTPTKRPVAPPVYRPQTKQAAVQAKTADRGKKKSTPAAPPVYRPRDESNPGPIDLVNHENSRAPVWFTTGGAGIGSDIEKYSYHHVLTLSCNVSELINANLAQTLNHSEGVSGEGTWSGYMVKSNEGGCFAVSTDKLPEFYRTYVTSHRIITKK